MGSKGLVWPLFGTLWNSLDTDTPIHRVEQALRSFAEAGAGFWRIRHSNVTALKELHAVRAELASEDAADPDALPDAIEAAVFAAINAIHHPHRDAGLEHFGFTPEGRKQRSKTERENRAAACLGRSGRWYRQANKRDYGGISPRDWITAQVAHRIAGVPETSSTHGFPPPISPAVISALGKSWRTLNHHLLSQPTDSPPLSTDIRRAITELSRPVEYILHTYAKRPTRKSG